MDFTHKKFAVISLGCDKNRVDTERMLSVIKRRSFITDDPSDAEIIVINTCAFLNSSRKEAIETVLEFNSFREEGKLEKLVVTGCLPQRFIAEIFDELTEADVFLGFLDYDGIFDAISQSYETGNRINYVGKHSEVKEIGRVITTPLHYSYLKIADGCNNHCTYCLIPSIRGKYKSEPIDKLIDEAAEIGELTELILVAQDVTRYGIDLYGKASLVELIQRLSALENVMQIRLLYCYPDMISNELIDEIKNNDKVIKYVDIPFQHADDRILKLMNRKGSGKGYLELIERLRSEIDGIAIRSTFITGFPGEDEQAHQNLIEFLKQARLDNAGFFAYSKEEGTASYKLKGHLPKAVKNKRIRELYSVQKYVSKKNLEKYKGKTIPVVFDEVDFDKGVFSGRAYFQAPDIDGKVYFTSPEISVHQGNRYLVKISKTNAYDLYGRVVDEFTE